MKFEFTIFVLEGELHQLSSTYLIVSNELLWISLNEVVVVEGFIFRPLCWLRMFMAFVGLWFVVPKALVFWLVTMVSRTSIVR